jgi:hypothetical protein
VVRRWLIRILGTDLLLIDAVVRALKRGNKALVLCTGRSIYGDAWNA